MNQAMGRVEELIKQSQQTLNIIEKLMTRIEAIEKSLAPSNE